MFEQYDFHTRIFESSLIINKNSALESYEENIYFITIFFSLS
jgi:hypothetical protein